MSTIITKRQFPHYHKYTMDLAGRPLTLEVGKLAELANAAVMVGYGDTRVLCCVTAAPRPRDGIDFFPLSVDFEEKMYSVGRIPGSFNRRDLLCGNWESVEGKPDVLIYKEGEAYKVTVFKRSGLRRKRHPCAHL